MLIINMNLKVLYPTSFDCLLRWNNLKFKIFNNIYL